MAAREGGGRSRTTKRRARARPPDRTPPSGDAQSCVPAIRDAVRAWRAGGYPGTTETTRRLLAYWFESDHRVAGGARFAYHAAQREAIEALVFVWEHARVRTRASLVARYADGGVAPPPADPFARYAIKMATGSGKTKVIALAVAWQFLNARREEGEHAAEYARTFLVIAPNVIVHERLRLDFAGGRVFDADPVIPRDMRPLWDLDCVMRGDGDRAHAEGALFLTNVQQLYERAPETSSEPEALAALLGPRPAAARLEPRGFRERIGRRDGRLMVLNDEAHHTHAEDGEWSAAIARLHERTPVNVQLDFSATPRFPSGALFPWIISDYPLKQAILDGIVKRPVRGVARVQEVASDRASIRYEGYLAAAVDRWRQYRDSLRPLGRKPVLFVMLASRRDADDVGAWLRSAYPDELGGRRTLVIHTNAAGEVTKAGAAEARALARGVDEDASDVGAIVSVLMLREGWDVRSVTVVLGLRAFTSRAEILPEQAIGRGLRPMFRGQPGAGYAERVDVIGNDAFLEVIDELERLEGIELDRVDLGEDRVRITTIAPRPERAPFDIALPLLSPARVRRRSLAEEIASLDVMGFDLPEPPLRLAAADRDAFEPRTAEEAIGTYARLIARELKLPSQFAALVPKVRAFFADRFFGERVDLHRPDVVRAMAGAAARRLAIDAFAGALRAVAAAPARAALLSPPRPLSTCPPFPWSQMVVEARRTVFDRVACDDEHELAFARFLDAAADVVAFAKLPPAFGFAIEHLDDGGNLRLFQPGWVVRVDDGRSYLLETKRIVIAAEALQRDRAALAWCENATALTDAEWRYVRVDRDDLCGLASLRFSDFVATARPVGSGRAPSSP